jgi:hypothetical protein
MYQRSSLSATFQNFRPTNLKTRRAVPGGTWTWTRAEFDPSQRAFYYVRVLEIPTPSWLAYDQVRLGLTTPEGAVLEQQDRAYTSPIWYTPEG